MLFEHIKKISHFGPLTICINGDCMGESLPHGSEVTVIRKSVYWPGDIIVLGRSDNQLFSHRFLGYLPGLGGLNAVTIADSETQPDPLSPASRILGKVVRINGEDSGHLPCLRIRSMIWFFRVLPDMIRTRLARSR
jgi:hypothetical protein